jgi:hypothetical protein
MSMTPHQKTLALEAKVKKTTQGAPDGPGVATQKDHAFVAPPGRPWARCTECGLAESTHTVVATPYVVHLEEELEAGRLVDARGVRAGVPLRESSAL